MRPERLEVEGFMIFRKPTVVDFSDTELFALTGPTGAGKSSLVDAMVFALYGAVPRHGRNQVAPVITQGKSTAKVRFDFTVDGREYSAVRVVNRGKVGATTSEARLQSGDRVLASSAREVDEAVVQLMGLDFEQFTTCVVLPQNKFERFLHAKPSDRQDLLIALLDLGIYEKVASKATERQRLAEGRLIEIDRALAGLTDIDESTREEASLKLEELTSIRTEIEEAQVGLERLGNEIAEVETTIKEVERRQVVLKAIQPPDGFAELAEKLAEAKRIRAELEEVLSRRESEVKGLRERLAGRNSEGVVHLIEWREALRARVERRDKTRQELESAQEEATKAGARRREAEKAHEHDLALQLRTSLVAGEPCPVCGQTVVSIPEAATAPDHDGERSLRLVDAESRRAEENVVGLRARLEEVSDQVGSLEKELENAPILEELVASLGEVQEIEASLSVAEKDIEKTRAQLAALEQQPSLAEEERSARRKLQEARDTVAVLNPPYLDEEDTREAWSTLTTWASDRSPELEADVSKAKERMAGLVSARNDLEQTVLSRCRAAGIVVSGNPRDALVEALSVASLQVKELDSKLELAGKLALERSQLENQASVASVLAVHLRASNFERWLLDEALRVLAEGANRRLGELGSGQYSLAVSERLEFEVVDHYAADERRPAKSLSGGETFLVSLALALSLADHITEMAATDAARLESIILDEGFGSLDSETLDTVSSVIAEVASGKTVGIITHVSDLAAQMPVRFEVSREVDGATVKKVYS